MHVCMYVCRNFHNLLYLNSHYFPVVGILNGRLDVEIGKNGKIFLEFINSRVKFFRVLHKNTPRSCSVCVCFFFLKITNDWRRMPFTVTRYETAIDLRAEPRRVYCNGLRILTIIFGGFVFDVSQCAWLLEWETSGAAYHRTATTMYHIPREHSGQHRCLFWLSVQLAGLFRCLRFSRHLYKQRAGWEWHPQMCQ